MVEKHLPKDVQDILNKIWVMSVPNPNNTVNMTNLGFIFGIAAAQYNKVNSNSIMARIATERAVKLVASGDDDPFGRELKKSWWIEHMDEMPRIWTTWYQKKITLADLDALEAPAEHLYELLSFFENREMQEKLVEHYKVEP